MRLTRFIIVTDRVQNNQAAGSGEIALPSPEPDAGTFVCLSDGTSGDSKKRGYNTTTTAGYNVVINNDRTKAILSNKPGPDADGIWIDIISVSEGEYEG